MAKKIIRDGEFYEEKGYEPLHSIDVEGYVKTDPKNYIISPQELAEILSGEGGSMIWSGTTIQDRIQNAVIGLTEDGKLNLGPISSDIINEDMSVAESLTALANASCSAKEEIESLRTDLVSLVSGAPETLDTLKEIAEWINNHDNDVSANILESLAVLNGKVSDEIAAREELLEDFNQHVEVSDAKFTALSSRTEEIASRAQLFIKNLRSRVKANENSIANLQSLVGDSPFDFKVTDTSNAIVSREGNNWTLDILGCNCGSW